MDFFVVIRLKELIQEIKNTLTKISKIVSGSNKRTLNYLYKIYNKIIQSKVIKLLLLNMLKLQKLLKIYREI